MKKFKIIILTLMLVPAFSQAAEGYIVTKSNTTTIDEHGTCKQVTVSNNNSYYVPTKYSTEWNSFLSNTPVGINLNSCSCSLQTSSADGCRLSGFSQSWSDSMTNKIGYYQENVVANHSSFAALTEKGKVVMWGAALGYQVYQPVSDPQTVSNPYGLEYRMGNKITGEGFVKVYPLLHGFLAVKDNGYIVSAIYPSMLEGPYYLITNIINGAFWDGEKVKDIYTTNRSMAVLTNSGKIYTYNGAWHKSIKNGDGQNINYRGNLPGTYSKVYTTATEFAALRTNGSIACWGQDSGTASKCPNGTGYTDIRVSGSGFVAMKGNKAVKCWSNYEATDDYYSCKNFPTNTSFKKIISNATAFAGITTGNRIKCWGSQAACETMPTSGFFSDIVPGNTSFIAVGSSSSHPLYCFGSSEFCAGTPTHLGDIKEFYFNDFNYFALTNDGHIKCWGYDYNSNVSCEGIPTTGGWERIYVSSEGYWGTSAAALKNDGSIACMFFGDQLYNRECANTPTDSGYTEIYTSRGGYTATKPDGTIALFGKINSYSFPSEY